MRVGSGLGGRSGGGVSGKGDFGVLISASVCVLNSRRGGGYVGNADTWGSKPQC